MPADCLCYITQEMKFSVIIPVYNVNSYLRECLDSLLAQSVVDWEAVCIDDGSTDGSGMILDEYADRDSRFLVVHKANGGVSSARNAALKVASGDWICFLDADDVWSPWMLASAQYAVVGCPDADVVRFKNCNFEECAEIEWRRPNFTNVDVVDMTSNVPYVGNAVCLWMLMFRREVISEAIFPNCAYYEDMVFVYRAFDKCNKLLDIDERLYGYRARPGSAMRSDVSEKWLFSLINSPFLALKVVESSPKCFTKLAFRQNCNKVTEEFYESLLRFRCDLACRRKWRHDWLVILRQILEFRKVRGFQRYRIWWLVHVPLIPIFYMLCFFPNWLKRKGFHR